MIDPTAERVQSAANVLAHFVKLGWVKVNPEELEVMAYLVLRYADTDWTAEEGAAEVERAVTLEVQKHRQRAREVNEAMERELIDRGLWTPPGVQQ